LPTTGYFGEKTEAAVRRYQEQKGLEVDGKAGENTLKALGLYPGQERASTAAQPSAETSAQPPKVELPPVLSHPNHPDNGLYQQAMKGLEQMPAGTFRSAQERENAAASIAFEAKVSGLNQIDHVKVAANSAGFFAVQGALEDPTNRRVYVDREQAIQQTVQQSTQLMQQAIQPQSPAQDTPQPRENPSRGTLVA
jgi:putative chitinase